MEEEKRKALANYLHINESQIREELGAFYANPEIEFKDVYHVFTLDEASSFFQKRGQKYDRDEGSHDYSDHMETVNGKTFHIFRID